MNICWLVVLTILKHISQWAWDYPIYEMENKIHVWNHQPVLFYFKLPTICVNYNISLTWIVGPFGDDSPKINYDFQWARTGFGRYGIYPDIWIVIPTKMVFHWVKSHSNLWELNVGIILMGCFGYWNHQPVQLYIYIWLVVSTIINHY